MKGSGIGPVFFLAVVVALNLAVTLGNAADDTADCMIACIKTCGGVKDFQSCKGGCWKPCTTDQVLRHRISPAAAPTLPPLRHGLTH
ncbi:hypothetical protein ABFS83_09G096000 [Erythranthe nasuta]